MAERVRIKVGSVEFEYEGDSKFSKDDIEIFFSHIEKLIGKSEAIAPLSIPNSSGNADADPGGASTPTHSERSDLHINSICSILNVKTGAELVLAAAASLQIVDGKDRFSRVELLARMKDATSYYNANHTKNLSYNLKSAVGKSLNQLGTGAYALKAEVKRELEQKLAP
ncbi:hypothetical protein [uncultured Hoeflea sp.]|mgnify:CR=1 FL=1|uniref:hypothetical protein n=1 Tax=uncultured Hoeflea sp. TaxID=538666 RepID=UPI0030EC3DCE|tara:strand:- start:39694 stop:40200 length:507 start_codon:yes stop_codon:yes gene_type:complete